jgi:hypothetical protein
MTVLHLLWLPILLSSVFIFVASSLIHMATPWHRGDFSKLPDEDKAMDALRPIAIPPGDYMVPFCTRSSDAKSPGFAEKIRKGPVFIATVMPNGPMPMARSLILWFLYVLVIGFFTGLVVVHALPVDARSTKVFHVTAVTSLLGYSGALFQFSIWYRRSWCTTMKTAVDGLIYAVITAGTFVWLWPK